MIEIIPAILTDDLDEAKDMLFESESKVSRVQIDIIDGEFANNTTIVPEDLAKIKTKLLLDYHLMVDEPVNWVERCVRGQADRIIGHIEKMKDQKEFIEKVKENGLGVGLAIDTNTPISDIDTEVLNKLDVILVMSVPAGFGGQEFKKEVITKISKLAKLRSKENYSYRICDDGGITIELVDDVHYLGADEVSIGKRLFKGDLEENIKRFQVQAHKVN